jgi:hypothetical protein
MKYDRQGSLDPLARCHKSTGGIQLELMHGFSERFSHRSGGALDIFL